MAWGDLTVGAGYAGAPDNAFLSSPDDWWRTADTGRRGLLDRTTDFLGSKEGQAGLSKFGTSLLGAAPQANPSYLKIAAGSPPFSPGSGNSLLNTLLQMQLQQRQLQQFPLGQNFRPSLLG